MQETNLEMEILSHIVEAGGERLDKYTQQVWQDFSRSFIQKLIKDEKLTVNNKVQKANYIVQSGDEIVAQIEVASEINIVAENIPLDIAYEDSDIIVINKPRGMVVHPAPGNYTGTLVNALMYYCKDLSGINGEIRPGIVHRLDKETSGLIVVAKNDAAHVGLQNLWVTKEMNRWYTALVYGEILEPAGRIEAPIGRHPNDRKKMAVTPNAGREAFTNYEVIERLPKYTLLKIKLETGRTHQIRVHFNFLGHSVVGDEIYGRGKNDKLAPGQLLHSTIMKFPHPLTGEMLEIESKLPCDFEEYLVKLRSEMI